MPAAASSSASRRKVRCAARPSSPIGGQSTAPPLASPPAGRDTHPNSGRDSDPNHTWVCSGPSCPWSLDGWPIRFGRRYSDSADRTSPGQSSTCMPWTANRARVTRSSPKPTHALCAGVPSARRSPNVWPKWSSW